jgi:hypothetical protein
MGDRPGNFPGCAQVRTKVYRKEYGWSMWLVYDPRGLPGVMTVRPRVAVVLHKISDPNSFLCSFRSSNILSFHHQICYSILLRTFPAHHPSIEA